MDLSEFCAKNPLGGSIIKIKYKVPDGCEACRRKIGGKWFLLTPPQKGDQ